MSGKQKGYLLGTGIAVMVMLFVEWALYSRKMLFHWGSIPLFLLLLFTFNLLTVTMFVQDEKVKIQKYLDTKEGTYQVKYRLECTYYVNAKNKNEALKNLRPFEDVKKDEIELLYIGAKNMNVVSE